MAEYIDREKIQYSKRTLEAWYGCQRDDFDAMVAFKDEIDEIPAANVRPVVRGNWEHFGSDVFRCSECGYGILPWNVGVNFCPNCGADMREPPKEESYGV